MKKLSLILSILFLTVSIHTSAPESRVVEIDSTLKSLMIEQDKKWQEYNLHRRIDRRINRIHLALTLTNEQKKKIRPIIKKYYEELNTSIVEIRPKGVKKFLEKETKLRSATDKSIESILTKGQFAKYNSIFRRRKQDNNRNTKE